MRQIAPLLYIGTERDVPQLQGHNWSLVNVANTYHYSMLQWSRGVDYKEDEYYLIYQKEHIFSVNWVDGPANLFNWQGKGVSIFRQILSFIDQERKANREVIIFCNQGMSRSPTVGLLYIAKYLHLIPSESFRTARDAFIDVYPLYNPKGIADFVSEHWNDF